MKMKVVIVDYFLPGNTYTLELCKELGKICDLTLICKNNYHTDEELPFALYNILHTNSRNAYDQIKGYSSDLRGIIRIVKKVRPDVLHLEQFVHQFWESLVVRHLKKHTKITVFTSHNILSHEAKAKEKEKLNKWYKLFDGLVVHNNASMDMLREMSDYSGSICVMPHGCYTQYEPVSIPRTDDRVTFLQFGLIREYKGVDILIDAIALLPDELKEKTRFVIAGKLHPSLKYNLNQLVEDRGLSGCVELILRRIEDEEMGELFARADACLFPYREIYGSGALLMAYSFEKPIIASDIPTFVEETDGGKCGFLFESENPEKLRDAIAAFCELSQEEREEFRKNVTFLKNGKYSWRNSSETVMEFYDRLIAGKAK